MGLNLCHFNYIQHLRDLMILAVVLTLVYNSFEYYASLSVSANEESHTREVSSATQALGTCQTKCTLHAIVHKLSIPSVTEMKTQVFTFLLELKTWQIHVASNYYSHADTVTKCCVPL